MVNHKNYNLKVDKDFVNFLTSKLITCVIDGFTSRVKSQSIAYLLIGSAHIYWVLDSEGEVHSIWDLQSSGLQKYKGFVFSKMSGTGINFRLGSEISREDCPNPDLTPPIVCKGDLISAMGNASKQQSVDDCQEFISVGFGWGVGFSTLYLTPWGVKEGSTKESSSRVCEKAGKDVTILLGSTRDLRHHSHRHPCL